MLVSDLFCHLASGKNDLVCVDNDDEVAHIHMWREGWLVLTAKKSCGMACEATEDYIGCIDDVPLARNIVRGRAKGTHSKLSFFDTSLLDPLLEQHSQAAEAEGEGYLPLSGGSKSVGPDWLGALVDLALGAKDEESGETPRKPAIVGDGNDRSLIRIQCSFESFGARKI